MIEVSGPDDPDQFPDLVQSSCPRIDHIRASQDVNVGIKRKIPELFSLDFLDSFHLDLEADVVFQVSGVDRQVWILKIITDCFTYSLPTRPVSNVTLFLSKAISRYLERSNHSRIAVHRQVQERVSLDDTTELSSFVNQVDGINEHVPGQVSSHPRHKRPTPELGEAVMITFLIDYVVTGLWTAIEPNDHWRLFTLSGQEIDNRTLAGIPEPKINYDLSFQLVLSIKGAV